MPKRKPQPNFFRYCWWCDDQIIHHSRLLLAWHNFLCWMACLPTGHVQTLAERAGAERNDKGGKR